jgi:aryl-alcohol dehydrogenase-like predicted oxidoreductase
MKLALGTVQFGMQYGVANKAGRVPPTEVVKILSKAKAIGIDTLDTAAAYGSSEEVLGQAGVNGFKVVSKLPAREASQSDAASWVTRDVERSLKHLKVSALYGFLLHRPLELLNQDGETIFQTLLDLKKQGLIGKLGASVYCAEDLEQLAPHSEFDLVQVPVNLFDRRMIESGWLKRLRHQGTEIHVRSAFLQGLLLMPPDGRPAYFKPWHNLFDRFDNWLRAENLSPLEACLGFLNKLAEVDRVIVGVESVKQLTEIGAAASVMVPDVPEDLQATDLALINPALWKL